MTHRWFLQTVALAVLIAVAAAPALASGKPATRLEGRVIAKTSTTLTILVSATKATAQVDIAAATKISGERRSFTDVAIGDMVRIDAEMNAGIMTAAQIDVVARVGSDVNSAVTPGAVTTGAGAGVSVDVGGGIDLHLP